MSASRTEGDPSASPLPSKLYFRIGEVAELVGVERHVLRYWEREFRSVRPTKSARGQRVYSRRDVQTLIRVRELLYNEGFTIAGAKKKLAERHAESARSDPPAGPESARSDPPAGPESARSDPPAGPESARSDPPPAGATEPTMPAVHEAYRLSPEARAELRAVREEVSAFLAELDGKRP